MNTSHCLRYTHIVSVAFSSIHLFCEECPCVYVYLSKTGCCTWSGLRYYEIIAAVFIIKTYWNLQYFFHRVFFTQYAYCVVIPFWKVLLSTVMHVATFMCTCWFTCLYKLWHGWTVALFIRCFGYLLLQLNRHYLFNIPIPKQKYGSIARGFDAL